MTEDSPRRKRGGGRAGNARRGGAAIDQLPWHIPEVSDKPTEPLSAEGIEAIHNAAMRILEEIGIDFLHEGARQRLKEAGADVTDGEDRVRMDRNMVSELVAKAPSQFTLTPRNPARQVTIGGNHQVYVNVSSPPSCTFSWTAPKASTELSCFSTSTEFCAPSRHASGTFGHG